MTVTPPVDVLPAAVHDLVAGATWHPLRGEAEGTQVYRLTFDDRADLVAKVAAGDGPATLLAAEAARLDWLAGQLPVPVVERFESGALAGGTVAVLITDALDGTDGSDPAHRVEGPDLARSIGEALRAVHGLDVASCPFDARLAGRVAEAGRRVEAGLVDRSQFERAYQRYEPAELYQHLLASMPEGDEDLVVTHGDFTAENLLFVDGRFTGYVDWGRAGVADRYVDLAVAARSVAHLVGPESLVQLFDGYGVDEPALAKIDFYVLADEFF
jgi:aminoglycoside phosphotransferase